MTDEPEVGALLVAADQFIVPLRMGEGIDEVAYDRLCGALHRCADAWRGRDAVPKRAANVLVDLYPAVEAGSYMYGDDYLPTVLMAAEEIGHLARSCVAV